MEIKNKMALIHGIGDEVLYVLFLFGLLFVVIYYLLIFKERQREERATDNLNDRSEYDRSRETAASSPQVSEERPTGLGTTCGPEGDVIENSGMRRRLNVSSRARERNSRSEEVDPSSSSIWGAARTHNISKDDNARSSGDDNLPLEQGQQERPSLERDRERPSLEQDRERPSLERDRERPSLEQDRERPSLERDRERPSLEQDRERPSLEQDRERPSLERDRERPSLERDRERPSLERDRERPSLERDRERPSLERDRERPSLERDRERPSLERDRERPSLERDRERPSLERDRERPSLERDRERPSLERDRERPSLERDRERPSLEQDQQESYLLGDTLRICLIHLQRRLSIVCSPDSTLLELARMHFPAEVASGRRIRYIYRGQLLPADRTLREQRIATDEAIHIHISPHNQEQQQPTGEAILDISGLFPVLLGVILVIVWAVLITKPSLFVFSTKIMLYFLSFGYLLVLYAQIVRRHIVRT